MSSSLKMRDTISASSKPSYEAFMSNIADSSFLSWEHKDNMVIVYEHNSKDDSIVRTGWFEASGLAAEYFEQEKKIAVRMGLIENVKV